MNQLARSFLYVPADNLDRLLRSNSRGADAVIADLEDSQTNESRPQALSNVEQLLAGDKFDAQIWVRVFPEDLEIQIRAVTSNRLTGIVLPEVSLSTLRRLDSALSQAEKNLDRSIPVVGLVESASALRDIHPIASHPRITRLGMGEADLCADIGITGDDREAALLPLRLQVSIASAAAGLQPPIGSTSTNYEDLDSLRQSTTNLHALGFRARTAIHPRQLEVINSVFSPTVKEIEQARNVIALLDSASDQGSGVIADEAGNMIDAAVVRSAREVLARASTR